MIKDLVKAVISEFETIDKDIKDLQEKEIEIKQKINDVGDSYSLKDTEKTADLRNKLNLITESLTKAKQARKTMSENLSNDIRNTVIQLQQDYKKEFRAEHEDLKQKIIDTSKELRHLLKTSQDISNKALNEFKSESRKLVDYLDEESQKDFSTIGIGFNLVPNFEYSKFKSDKADLKIINYIIKESRRDSNFKIFNEVVS